MDNLLTVTKCAKNITNKEMVFITLIISLVIIVLIIAL